MPPEFGATFVPGGFDDYYMPEVVAPAPQRVTPQVPQSMQDDLQRMESEAGHGPPRNEPVQDDRVSGNRIPQQHGGFGAESTPDVISDRLDVMSLQGCSSSSPFPKLVGDNIPPGDDAKEEILWSSRKNVLHSQDVSMQISWARDVLNWVAIAIDAAARENAGKSRPPTPLTQHELRVDAISVVTYLADQEHPDALYMRSKWLEFGKFGNRVDRREAYNGYARAAALGHARSEYRIGMLYEQSNDIAKAKEHYYKGMSLKDSAALYRMGMMSLLGQHGEPQDFPGGLERILAAADSSDEDAPQGSYVYGMLIGRDLPDIVIPEQYLSSNIELARAYVEKAAYQGFAKAQLKMGQAYELCQLGCEFKPAYSLHYYGLAAQQGIPEAALGVSRWFLFGHEATFKKNEELAYKYACQAAAAKLPTGEFAMGYYYEIGIHVNKNVVEAKKWYELASEHGNTDAVGRLESLNQDQTLSKKDHETTTLTRIKSQHGSQRGKRPERFTQAQQHLPTLSESDTAGGKRSDGVSPLSSPGMKSPRMTEQIEFSNSSRGSLFMPDVQSAYNLRQDTSQSMRSQSAAPYPVDERPAPLNVARSKSTAPYPDDESSSTYAHSSQQGFGPQADRSMTAFGIRAQDDGNRRDNLYPTGPSNFERGKVPMPASRDLHSAPGAYRQPLADLQRPATTQPYPTDTSPPNKRHNTPSQLSHGGVHPAGSQPIYDYGIRNSPRSFPDGLPSTQRLNQQGYQARVPLTAASNTGRQDRYGSVPPQNAKSSPSNGLNAPDLSRPARGTSPGPMPGYGRVGAAPPAGSRPPPQKPPTAAKPSKGPATFEDMGIPQGKNEGDCIVM